MAVMPRRPEPELMDRPDLEEERHFHALRGLRRINHWSRAVGALYEAVAAVAKDAPQGLRILDIASGGGDVPIRLWRRGRRRGLRLEVTGCDVSPRAVAYAQRQAQAQRADVEFRTLDVLNDPLPRGYDVVMCTLFLHHLSEFETVKLLRRMKDAAGRLVAVDDLRRGRAAVALTVVGTRILTRSDVVHTDGLRSVRAAYTMNEALHLARAAGLHDAAIRPHWPFRFLLTWRKG